MNHLRFTLLSCVTFGFLLSCELSAVIPAQPSPTPSAPGALSGVVTWQTKGAGNVAVVGITVKVWKPDGSTQVGSAITDGSGNYQILNLPPGKYSVSSYQKASSVGTQIAEKCWVFQDVEVKAGKTTQLFMEFDNAAADALIRSPQCGVAPLPGSASASTDVVVTAKEFKFDTERIIVPAGQMVSITLKNEGVVQHTLVIPDLNVKLVADPRKSATTSFLAPSAGTYAFQCAIPGHKEAGMTGLLIVQQK